MNHAHVCTFSVGSLLFPKCGTISTSGSQGPTHGPMDHTRGTPVEAKGTGSYQALWRGQCRCCDCLYQVSLLGVACASSYWLVVQIWTENAAAWCSLVSQASGLPANCNWNMGFKVKDLAWAKRAAGHVYPAEQARAIARSQMWKKHEETRKSRNMTRCNSVAHCL